MVDEFEEHSNALARQNLYRVDAVLKESGSERTERVFFAGPGGCEQGPYVRKFMSLESGLGGAYQRIWVAQRAGRAFAHLPRILECYEWEGRRVVVMEHVAGETLADVVYRCDPSPALAADVFPRLCDAVRELHEQFDPPIIHRDLKPSNVMLSAENVTLIDFGISRTYDDEASEDTFHFGSRSYAPPEQFGYAQTDERSDVYALGMLLYFCLTERIPDASAAHEGYRSPGISEPVRKVIERAGAMDPTGRYQTVRDLQEAFHAACAECGWAAVSRPAANCPAASPAPTPAHEEPSILIYREAPKPLLSRVPRGIGIAWNVMLGVVWLLFAAACVSVTVAPQPDTQVASLPLGRRAVCYLALELCVVTPVLYAVCDRRPFRRIIPKLSDVPLWKEFAVCIAVAFVGLVVMVVSVGAA